MIRSKFVLILVALMGIVFTLRSAVGETRAVSHDANWVHVESDPPPDGEMPQWNGDESQWNGDMSQWNGDVLAPAPLHEVMPTMCNCGKQACCHGVCRDPGHPAKPKHKKPGDINRGDCPPLRYRMDDCKRAGKPHTVAKWAKCSVTDKYSAWFVGGGSPFACRPKCGSRGRESDEGTWGLDYGGLFGHAKVWLNYTRGREQGGEGQYQTDGEPRIVARAKGFLHCE